MSWETPLAKSSIYDFQNTYFSDNWTSRLSILVLVTTPKVLLLKGRLIRPHGRAGKRSIPYTVRGKVLAADRHEGGWQTSLLGRSPPKSPAWKPDRICGLQKYVAASG
jgi:hypothetical protein